MERNALARSVGQLLVCGFDGTEPSEEILGLIRGDNLGGVILYRKNCVDARQVLELANRLQDEARRAGHESPLFVAIDQEQGRVVRLGEGVTVFPAMGALARADDPALIGRVAGAVSRELLAIGVNWNLGPVADVLSVPGCPVGDRSCGSDSRKVAAMVGAFVRAAEAEGMLTCAKHFPGHGATGADSHFAEPVIERGREQLEAVDLPPFREAIAAGVSAVMPTHITFPALDPDAPASLSARVLGRLLRGELGFRGAVVSDDLEMAGVARSRSLEQSARAALAAGNDVLIVSRMLLPSRDIPGLLGTLRREVRSGAIGAAALETALARVRRLKERLAWRRDPGEAASVLRAAPHLALLEEARRAAGA